MNQQVTEYIQNVKVDWQGEICARLRELVNQSVPEVTERLQYSKPHFLKNGKYAAVFGIAKDWVSFTIFNAKSIEAPDGLFEAGDPDRKTIKIRKGQAVDYDLLGRLLQEASSTL
jgi:hypothetical protein